MFDMLRFGRRQHVLMRLQSPELWRFGVHWRGRTLLCPRPAAPACPACLVERGKYRGFALGVVRGLDGQHQTGLIELPQTALEGLSRLGVDFADVCGVTFAMERLPHPRGWSVTNVERVDCEAVPMEGLAMSLDVLFGLPTVLDAEMMTTVATDRMEWLRGHSRVLAAKIQGCGQNGSHQDA